MKSEHVTPDVVREALRATEDIWAGDSFVRVPHTHFFALRTAAESTLPKTKVQWQLSGWPGDRLISTDFSCRYDTSEAAEREAVRWLRQGGFVRSMRGSRAR